MDEGRNRSHRISIAWCIDMFVVTAVVATVVWRVMLTRHGWFYIDDWRLAQQSSTVGGIFSAYNGHLSVVILVMYRVTLELFGFSTYLPFRILGAISFASVGAAMYAALRRHVGRPIAFLVGAVMLWPAGITVEVSALNHWLAATAGVVCAVLLRCDETPRGNVLLAVMLAMALASADGGVAVGVACIVYVFCCRVTWKRRVAAIGPIVVWAMWWYLVGRSQTTKFPQHLGPWRLVQLLVYGIGDSATMVTFGLRINGWVILAALAILALTKARRGRAEMANVLAWLAALIFWWAGIAWFRAGGFTIYIFRYRYVGAVFLILACIPVRRVSWDSLRARIEAFRNPVARPLLAIAVWLVVVGIAGVSVVDRGIPSARVAADDLNPIGDRSLADARHVNQGPVAVPEDRSLGSDFYFLDAGDVRVLFRKYGGAPAPRR